MNNSCFLFFQQQEVLVATVIMNLLAIFTRQDLMVTTLCMMLASLAISSLSSLSSLSAEESSGDEDDQPHPLLFDLADELFPLLSDNPQSPVASFAAPSVLPSPSSQAVVSPHSPQTPAEFVFSVSPSPAVSSLSPAQSSVVTPSSAISSQSSVVTPSSSQSTVTVTTSTPTTVHL